MADLNFLNTDDCDAITFDTPTTGLQFIDYILGTVVKDLSDVEKYTITHSNNCCSPGVNTDIAPPYQLTAAIIACVSGTAPISPPGGPPPSGEYTFELTGINADLIQSLEYLGGAVANIFIPATYTVIPNGAIRLDVWIEDSDPSEVISFRITTTAGFVYVIEATVTQSGGSSCDGTVTNVNIIYPDLPDNIVEITDAVAASMTSTPAIGLEFTLTADNVGIIGNGITIVSDGVSTLSQLVNAYNLANPGNTITLTGNSGGYVPSLLEGPYVLAGGVDATYYHFGFNELLNVTTVVPGVYQIIFCETLYDSSSTCVQNHIFIECNNMIKCAVVNKLVLCVDSNIMDFYNALIWGNDCTDTITYEEFCALYEIMTIILETDGCYGKLDDCNCSDAATIANKLSPINYPTQTNGNPCQSC